MGLFFTMNYEEKLETLIVIKLNREFNDVFVIHNRSITTANSEGTGYHTGSGTDIDHIRPATLTVSAEGAALNFDTKADPVQVKRHNVYDLDYLSDIYVKAITETLEVIVK